MENPAWPWCKHGSCHPWLGFLAERRPELTPLACCRASRGVSSHIPAGLFSPPLLFKRKRGSRAAGTQWSYPRYNTSRTEKQVGQEGAQNAPGHRQGRKAVNPPGRSHRKRRTPLPNKQNVALRFLPMLHLLPGCWGRHHRGILSFFAFLFHPNPRDPCPSLSAALLPP